MPGFGGTGPLGKGPMTGKGRGFCVLTESEENPNQIKGFAGLQGVLVGQINGNYENNRKEVIDMPGGDRTGPNGAGPMTGRAAGFCADYPEPGYLNSIGGRGFGSRGRGFWGRGGGRGWRNRFYATGLPGWAIAGQPASADVSYAPGMPTVRPEQELADLKQQAEYCENTLDRINKRIEQLETESNKKQ